MFSFFTPSSPRTRISTTPAHPVKTALAGCLVALAGCNSAPTVVSHKDADYSGRIESVVIVVPVPQSSKTDEFGWSKYADGQLGKIADQMITRLDAKGAKATKLMIAQDEPDADGKIRQAIRSHGADHLVGAQWQSDPADMAQNIVTKLTEDGLLRAQ